MPYPLYANVSQGDNFDRPDEILDHGKWVVFGSLTPMQIVSNQAQGDGINYCGSYFQSPVMTAIEMSYKLTAPSNDLPKYLKVRINGSGGEPFSDVRQNCYQLTVDEINTSEWLLTRKDLGVDTLLTTAVISAVASGDFIALQAIGSVITGYQSVGGAPFTQIITATDATYPTGKAGIVVAPSSIPIDLFAFGGVFPSPVPGPQPVAGRGATW